MCTVWEIFGCGSGGPNAPIKNTERAGYILQLHIGGGFPCSDFKGNDLGENEEIQRENDEPHNTATHPPHRNTPPSALLGCVDGVVVGLLGWCVGSCAAFVVR